MTTLRLLRRLLTTAVLATFMAATACAPAPSRVLNDDEKLADMLWLFSIFDQNYAPRELKEETFEFDYEELKDVYLEKALATEDNEAFYAVMHGFVAQFQDAHTSSSLVASTLPGRTKIAFLGFNGVRLGDNLSVTELLPTTASSPNFPIHVGDEIVALDGKPLRDIVLDDMVQYRSLGYDEANLTYHMNGIFTRTPLVTPLPTAPDAVLTVNRGGSTKTIKLPWVVKDLQTFLEEQALAASGSEDELFIGGMAAQEFLAAATEMMESNDLSAILDVPVAGLPHERPWDYFKFVDNMPTLASPSLIERVRAHIRSKTTKASIEDITAYLGSVRNVPFDAIVLPDSPTYPVYIAQFPGELPLRPFYAYMLLDNFTPLDEAAALGEIQAVLGRLSAMGIKHLIIDTIDNGGGSLNFGMLAAALLSKQPLELPQIQYKTSETWIDSFETQSIFAPSDAERELARRVMEDLKEARDAGKVVSEPMSIDTLMPFQFLDGNESLGDFEIVLLVNEMCVSMCDIFAGVLQDNELATIIGKRTMGGGGNVVQHAQAPNSHLAVAQTESLILRSDGTPIENVGVTPDIEMEVNETAFARYDDVRQKAIDILNPCQDDCSPADDLGDKASSGGCSVGGNASGSAIVLLIAAIALTLRRRRRI